MEWNKETLAAAFIIIAGSNISGVANIISSDVRSLPYTSLDAARDKAEIMEHADVHFAEELARHVDNEKAIQRLEYRMSQCERFNQ